jgi:translation elongation factor P/translation initiation factor 5A
VFETFDSPPPDDKEINNKLIEGNEVEYWKVLGKTKIVRIR